MNNRFESISVEAAIETIYEDICSIEDILFEYSGSGKLKETVVDKKTLKIKFSDHISSIKENIEMIKNRTIQDDSVEKSNKRPVYLAGKCYTTNQFYHALKNNKESDEELDTLWNKLLGAMVDFNEAVMSDPRIYDMDKALQIYKQWTNQ